MSNILFCYNQEKLGAIKRANCIQKQVPKEIEIHTVPVQEIQDIDDEYTHVILDKTAINIPIEQEQKQEQKYEQKLVLTNCHREQYQKLDVNEMLVYDYKMPYTICRYDLQYPYEQQYKYIGPLVEETKPKDKVDRLLVLGGDIHLFDVAKYIVENVNDVKWVIAPRFTNEYEILKDLNNYDHEIIFTDKIETLLEKAKYVVHYGSHQLTMECIKANCVQLVVPPQYPRYYFQQAYRIRELIIGSFVYDIFHQVSVEYKYKIIQNIEDSFNIYKNNLQRYREKVENENEKVVTCTLPMIFTQNSRT